MNPIEIAPKRPLKTAHGLIAIMACLMLAGCCTQMHCDPASHAAVRDYIDEFVGHWGNGNTGELIKLFTEDGIRVVSREQLPATGRAAIARTFETGFADEGFKGASLHGVVTEARTLENDLVLAHGTWHVKDAKGALALEGKWGNVFEIKDGKVRMIMESAHANIGEDFDRSIYATMPRRTLSAKATGDPRMVKAVQASVDRYIAGIDGNDPEKVANEFTEDGIRVVSSTMAPSYGRNAILGAVRAELAAGSPFEKTTLHASIHGVRQISPHYLVAHGSWAAKSADGKIVTFGQWGNVLRIQEDGSVKMLMESAGGYIPPTS